MEGLMRDYRNDRRILGIMIFRRLGRRLVGIGLLLRVRRLWIKLIRVCEVFRLGIWELGLQGAGYTWLMAGSIVGMLCKSNFPKVMVLIFLDPVSWVPGVRFQNLLEHLVIFGIDGDIMAVEPY